MMSNIKHGLKGTKLYNTWLHIKTRCYNQNYNRYKDWGGRGITMCDEWLHDPVAFYDWAMSNGYKEDLTIDRIDVNGNYEPDNCRWVDRKTQSNNRRDNVKFTYDNKTLTIAQWSRELGIPENTIRSRYLRGKSVEKCLQKVK